MLKKAEVTVPEGKRDSETMLNEAIINSTKRLQISRGSCFEKVVSYRLQKLLLVV